MLSALVNPALHLIHYGIPVGPAPIILATMYNELSPAEAFSFNAILRNTTTDHEVHIYVYLLHGSGTPPLLASEVCQLAKSANKITDGQWWRGEEIAHHRKHHGFS